LFKKGTDSRALAIAMLHDERSIGLSKVMNRRPKTKRLWLPEAVPA